MVDDAELARIARAEAAQRVESILDAIRRGNDERRWDEVYRQSHSLAGIAVEIGPGFAADARRLYGYVSDPRGARRTPSEQEEAELARLATRLRDRIHQA